MATTITRPVSLLLFRSSDVIFVAKRLNSTSLFCFWKFHIETFHACILLVFGNILSFKPGRSPCIANTDTLASSPQQLAEIAWINMDISETVGFLLEWNNLVWTVCYEGPEVEEEGAWPSKKPCTCLPPSWYQQSTASLPLVWVEFILARFFLVLFIEGHILTMAWLLPVHEAHMFVPWRGTGGKSFFSKTNCSATSWACRLICVTILVS